VLPSWSPRTPRVPYDYVFFNDLKRRLDAVFQVEASFARPFHRCLSLPAPQLRFFLRNFCAYSRFSIRVVIVSCAHMPLRCTASAITIGFPPCKIGLVYARTRLPPPPVLIGMHTSSSCPLPQAPPGCGMLNRVTVLHW
jgi:hypothetical protein